MKVKKSLVEQIIKEEAVKVKKLIALNEEKKAIFKQLNELYEESPEESVMQEEDSLISLIPATDQQIVQQADQQPIQQAEVPLDEGKIWDAVKNLSLTKVKDAVIQSINRNPQEAQQAKAALMAKYAGKSFGDIYADIKSHMGIAETESGKMSVKDAISKACGILASFAGYSGLAGFFGAAATIVATGSGFGLPTMLATGAAISIAVAIVSGIAYIITKAK